MSNIEKKTLRNKKTNKKKIEKNKLQTSQDERRGINLRRMSLKKQLSLNLHKLQNLHPKEAPLNPRLYCLW